MKVLPEEIARAMAQNLGKSLPYLKQTIRKMEYCCEEIESLPPCEDRLKTVAEFENLEEKLSEIFKNIRDAFSKFVLAYWAYTDPHALTNETCMNWTETITSDAYKDFFCVFDVAVEIKNNWIMVKTPPIPGRYKQYKPFGPKGCYTDYSSLYKRELEAALSRKFARLSSEESMKICTYPKKNIAYIFSMPKDALRIIDADNRDTKTTTDVICDHMLTDDGARCTSFESFSVSDKILPVGTYIVVSPNFGNPPSLSELIDAIKMVNLG